MTGASSDNRVMSWAYTESSNSAICDAISSLPGRKPFDSTDTKQSKYHCARTKLTTRIRRVLLVLVATVPWRSPLYVGSRPLRLRVNIIKYCSRNDALTSGHCRHCAIYWRESQHFGSDLRVWSTWYLSSVHTTREHGPWTRVVWCPERHGTKHADATDGCSG